jgi:ethanolamine utilization protein EutA
LEPEEGRRLCGLLADQLREAAEGGRPSLLLTRPLEHNHRLGELRVTFSGGVSEYLFGHEPRGYGDLARELAGAIRIVFEAGQAIVESAGEGIRATVIGASQFTVEVSGNTVHVGGEELLPIHSVPVVRPILAAGEVDADDVAAAIARAFSRLDLVEGGSPAALAISWKGEPGYAALRALAGGVARGLARSLAAGMPVLLVLDADVGRSVGAILQEEFGAGANLIVLDGLELKELDYVDVGRVLRPAGVVPVIVKSLAFAKATGAPPAGPAQRDRRSRTGGRA